MADTPTTDERIRVRGFDSAHGEDFACCVEAVISEGVVVLERVLYVVSGND